MDTKIVSKITFFRILTFLILPLIAFFPGVSSRGQGGGRGIGRFNSGGGRNFGNHHFGLQGLSGSRHSHSGRYFGYRNPYRPRDMNNGDQFYGGRHHQSHIQDRFTDFGSGRYQYSNRNGEIFRNRGFGHRHRDREMIGMGIGGVLPVGIGLPVGIASYPLLPYGGPGFGEFYDPYYPRPGYAGDFYSPPPPPLPSAQLLPPGGNFISQNPTTNVIQQDTSIYQPITNIANTENNNLIQQTPTPTSDAVLPSNPPLDSKIISQPAPTQSVPDKDPTDFEKIKQELSSEPEPEIKDKPEPNSEPKAEDQDESDSKVNEIEVEETIDQEKNQWDDNNIEIMDDHQLDFSDSNANEGLFFLRNNDFD